MTTTTINTTILGLKANLENALNKKDTTVISYNSLCNSIREKLAIEIAKLNKQLHKECLVAYFDFMGVEKELTRLGKTKYFLLSTKLQEKFVTSVKNGLIFYNNYKVVENKDDDGKFTVTIESVNKTLSSVECFVNSNKYFNNICNKFADDCKLINSQDYDCYSELCKAIGHKALSNKALTAAIDDFTMKYFDLHWEKKNTKSIVESAKTFNFKKLDEKLQNSVKSKVFDTIVSLAQNKKWSVKTSIKKTVTEETIKVKNKTVKVDIDGTIK